ncbi:MAG: polysaccharide deacetylase family protein [Bacteroidetes bacterium]|nr:MAG: polysaccharide deacetylase family protein [Bacteroidota bacterium]
MFYLPHTPAWLRALFPKGCVWQMPATTRAVYLTFDDGPHAEATPYVLEQLERYSAKASFFCIGKNVVAHPELYTAVLEQGHTVGNHTMHHLNGAKVSATEYVANYNLARQHIHADIFRPPYGRISKAQATGICALNPNAKIVMWSVLSGDFDQNITGERCFQHIKKHTKSGSIVVFHDSAKALPRLRVALPKTLEWLQDQGYKLAAL